MKKIQQILPCIFAPVDTSDSQTSMYFLRSCTLCLLLCPALTAWFFSLHLAVLAPLGPWILPASAILSAGIASFLFRNRLFSALTGAALALILVSLAFVLSTYHFAPAFDAAAYHYPATILISKGWNPLWNYTVVQMGATLNDVQMKAIQFYPKTQWYIGVASYLLSGKITSGNWTNLIFLLITGSIAYELARLKTGFPNWLAILFAMAAMLNPVAILQNQSGYLDGIVGSNIAIFFFAFLCFLYSGKRYYLLILGIAFMFASTTKTTGFLFISLLTASLVIISIKNHFMRIRSIFYAICVTLIFFLPLLINPYLYNTVEHMNPFFPVFSSDEISTIASSRFEQLQLDPHDRVYNFFHTQVFTNGIHSKKPKVWTPARFDYSILTPPMQNGGFGPLFGPIFLLGLTLTILLLIKGAFWETAVCLSIALCIFVSPATIIARYHAHVWLLPLMASFFLMQRSAFELPAFGVGIALLVTMVVNSFMIAYVITVKNVDETIHWRKKIKELRGIERKSKINLYGVFKMPYTLNTDFYTTVFKDETGIKLHPVNEKEFPPDSRRWYTRNRGIVFYISNGKKVDNQ